MSGQPDQYSTLNAGEKRELLVSLLWEKLRGASAAEPASPGTSKLKVSGKSGPMAETRRYNTIIESLGVYLPPNIVHTEDVLAGCEADIAFPLGRVSGIEARHVAGDTEFSIDLAESAVEACLSLSRYGPRDIDALICCNISRYDSPASFTYEPSTSARLRHRFGLAQALAFDVTNACAGMFTGIRLADTLLQTGAIDTAMIVSGEYITHLTRSAQKELTCPTDPQMACLTLGDAGAALVLTRSDTENVGFQEIDLCTLPQYASYCIARLSDQAHGEPIMLTRSIEMTRVMIDSAGFSLLMLPRWNSMAGRFQHYVPHQTSSTTIKAFLSHANSRSPEPLLDESAVIDNLRWRGNTASTSHFVAVHDAVLSGRIKSGDTVAFGIAASGMTAGTAIYTFDDLPERLRQQKAKVNTDSKAYCRSDGTSNELDTLFFRPPGPPVRIDSVGVVPLDDTSRRDTLGLAVSAAQDCLGRSSYSASDIDLLLFAGVYRTGFVFEPAIATFIAHEMGMDVATSLQTERRILAFDIFNSSIGFLQAAYLVMNEIELGHSNRAMIIAAEIEPDRDIPGSTQRGIQEAGSAMILDQAADERYGFGLFGFRYNTDSIEDFSSYVRLGPIGNQGRLGGNRPRNFERYYVGEIQRIVDDLLRASGLDRMQIKAVFPPQISTEFTSELSNRLVIPRERFVDVARDADLFSSSLAYGLRIAQDQRLITEGDIGLLISVGVGIQVGCAVYHF